MEPPIEDSFIQLNYLFLFGSGPGWQMISRYPQGSSRNGLGNYNIKVWNFFPYTFFKHHISNGTLLLPIVVRIHPTIAGNFKSSGELLIPPGTLSTTWIKLFIRRVKIWIALLGKNIPRGTLGLSTVRYSSRIQTSESPCKRRYVSLEIGNVLFKSSGSWESPCSNGYPPGDRE